MQAKKTRRGTEKIESYMQRKYFRSMLISSVFLFFLPLLLCVTSFSIYQSRLYHREWLAARASALTRVSQLMDEQLSFITRVSGLLNVNPSVQQFYQSEGNMLMHYEVTSVLNAYCEANNLIADIYLYQDGTNLVYTRNQKLLLSPQNIALSVDGQDYAKTMTAEENLRRFALHHFCAPYSAVSSVVTYTAPVFRRNHRNTLVSTVFLDASAMQASFSSILSMSGNPPLIVLLNSQNECLFEMGAPQQSVIEALRSAGDNVPERLRMDGLDYYISSVESGVADWRFYLLTPADMAGKGAIPILGVLLLVALLEGIILYAFMHINYRPLHSTYEAIRSLTLSPERESRRAMGGATNELGDIEDTVYSLVHDLHSLNETMISQKPALQQMFWLDVINGKFENESALLKKAEALGLSLRQGDSFILVVKPRNGEVFCPGDQARLDALLGDFFPHELLMNVNQINSAFLCMAADGMQSIQQQLSMFIEQAEQALDIHPVAGAGGVHRSYIHISHSYLEARTAVDLHSMLGTPLVMYDGIRPLLEGMWTGNKQADFYTRRLESCILREDDEAIHQCFNDLDVLIENASPPLIFLRRICFDLNVLIYNTLKKRRTEQPMRSQTDLMDELFGMCSREDAALFLRKLEQQLFPQPQAAACTPDIAQMIEYLHKNYSRPDFSCNEAATHFGMQPSSFSRFFKQQTGELPINFLTTLRMEAAKQLLVSTDASLNDIVLSVGYYSTSSFIKRFREYEKMTPVAYRTAHKAQ